MKVALKLAYLGDNYYGFQKQPDLSLEVQRGILMPIM